MDEKIFTVQPVRNSQTNWVMGKNLRFIPWAKRSVFRRMKPASVMVWAGVMSNGKKLPLIFVDIGVRINRWKYKAMLEETVAPWLTKTYGGVPYIFQQDGAPSHTAKIVQAFCQQAFPHFWNKQMWPPSSPDLNPTDFSV